MSNQQQEGITDPGDQALAGLFQLATAKVEVWEQKDLPDLWQHQLSASLEIDMQQLHPSAHDTLQATLASGEQPPERFQDLLTSARPPVDVLIAVKDYAKKRQAEKEFLPREICLALYYLVIALARVRCGTPISSLDAAALKKAFTWALSCDWLDAHSLEIFSEALATVA